MNEIEIMMAKNRIAKLSGKNPIGNLRIINKLKRRVRKLEAAR